MRTASISSVMFGSNVERTYELFSSARDSHVLAPVRFRVICLIRLFEALIFFEGNVQILPTINYSKNISHFQGGMPKRLTSAKFWNVIQYAQCYLLCACLHSKCVHKAESRPSSLYSRSYQESVICVLVCIVYNSPMYALGTLLKEGLPLSVLH